MLNYRKATNEDHSFIDELLNISYEDHTFGIGYPRGDLEDIAQDLEEYDQDINDSFYIIEQDNIIIGTIGALFDDKEVILIGPYFLSAYYKENTICAFLKLFLTSKVIADRTIKVCVISENKILTNSLTSLNAISESNHVSMSYDMNEYVSSEDGNQMRYIDVSVSEQEFLEKISYLLKSEMPYPVDSEIQDLIDYLEQGYTITAAVRNKEIIGILVWIWYEKLHFGRLDYLCVNSNYQRQGIGTNLLKHVMNRIKFLIHVEEGNLLYLDVSPTNVKACECYKKISFKIDFHSTKYHIPKIFERVQKEYSE